MGSCAATSICVHWQESKAEKRNCHINIGTGEEISIRDLVALIADWVGFRGDVAFDPAKPDGMMRKLTDPSRLHALGWPHSVELAEGIDRMYTWCTA